VDGKEIPVCEGSWNLPGIALGVVLPHSKIVGQRQDVRLTLRRGDEERVITIQDQ
jgi:hypothetical protein